MEERLRENLCKLTSNPVQWDCPLAPFTSFGIGGPAEALITVESSAELFSLLKFFTANDLHWRLIGKGSNLLVSDEGFAGGVLLFGKALSGITPLDESASGDVRIRVGAGCSMARLLSWCMKRGYAGLEFSAGIPGSLGGAVVMNAGAWGGEIADVIRSLNVLSLNSGEEILSRRELDFRYRLWHNQADGDVRRLVLSVDICLKQGDKEEVQSRCHKYLQQRKEKQPKAQKNAGSFFKNPPGDSAGRLIEASGLKGKNCGGAMVSPVHANFLVNTGMATADDVQKLMQIVTDKVKEDSGIQLQPEVHFL
ncbi:MAG: UDP-N-acetylmuramate dehydrogenase [Thermodesulfobacteriota bacterium]|nr:UDP-N-acetylmuramate dehydrogenase [Thermodesulfobacteriota bacterium]